MKKIGREKLGFITPSYHRFGRMPRKPSFHEDGVSGQSQSERRLSDVKHLLAIEADMEYLQTWFQKLNLTAQSEGGGGDDGNQQPRRTGKEWSRHRLRLPFTSQGDPCEAPRIEDPASGHPPARQQPDDAGRLRNQEINAILKTYADGKTVHWPDIGQSFLNADGTMKRDLMPDALHHNLDGYRVWAEAMKPTLDKLMSGK